jgi:serine/threonine protein kinase
MTAILKAGRYEIVGELGRGAMGVVYKATDPVIGRPVAVKTIKLSEQGTGLTRSELIARFQTEARAAGLLTHHNIVVIYDAGEEDGLFYITMELVEGKSLQTLLDDGHAFPLPRVLRIMEQACNALQFAHENNIVHRDIKPANIMLTGDDTVKVTDFGTAKILQFGTVQQTAHVMGTPSYMSPEQVKGRAVDGRTDIFSLGVMFYEMITGEKPFPGESITTVIYKIVNEEPVPPRTIDPTIHPGISAAVLRALAKEPEDRYQSCHEFLEDLRNYRNIANEANPRATIASLANRNAQPNATVAMNPGLRGITSENPQMTPGRRGASDGFAEPYNANPMQTPPLRRTDQIPVYEPPKEKSIVWTVLAALLLLAVIAFGAYKLKPVLYDVRHPEVRNEATANAATAAANTATAPTTTDLSVAQDSSTPASQPAAAEATQPNSTSEKTDSQLNATPNASDASNAPIDSASRPTKVAAPENVTSEKGTAEKVVTEKPASEKIPVNAEETPRKQPAVAKTPLTLTPKAAQVKEKIEDAIAERNWSGKASVQGVGNTLTITGKLRPGQHAALLNLLHDVPAGVKIVDSISDTDVTPAPSASPEAAHNVPTATPAPPTTSSDEPKVTGSRVAWADVKTWPTGAEIFIDDKSTGQTTPARVQVPSGVHVFTLHLEGFKDLRRGVDVSDGGTVDVRGILRRH